MTRQLLMMMCCVFTLGLLNRTDSALQLIVSPDTMTMDLTTSLDVNCTFSYKNPTNISNLVSLVVSKSDDDDKYKNNTFTFQDLVTINEFGPSQVTIITPVNASVSGQISTVGTSYLSLQWAYPTTALAGSYRCKAQGMDSVGQVLQEDDTKLVTAPRPGLDQLIDLVKLQQLQMDNMMKILVSLTGNLANVDNKVSSLTSDLSTLNNTVSDGIKDLNNKYKEIVSTLVSKSYIKSADYQRNYYLLSKEEPGSEHEAQASCLPQGGYLAEINDVNEHSFIQNFLQTSAHQSTLHLLVGAKVQDFPGTWVFSHSHQVVNYTDWAPNYPNNENRTCVFLRRPGGWSMANYDCTVSNDYVRFLCEIPTR